MARISVTQIDEAGYYFQVREVYDDPEIEETNKTFEEYVNDFTSTKTYTRWNGISPTDIILYIAK